MNPERKPDIVVIGASAGGVAALQKVVAALPVELDAAVFVVLHLLAESESFLPQILSRAGALQAVHASDNAMFETGRIYVAPPDRHLLFNDGNLRVIRGPKENRHRPAIDVLFRSAAMTYGERVVGVLLTGADDDGTAGVKVVQERGGITVVQDPEDSAFPDMPMSALRVTEPDFTLPLAGIGPLLGRLVQGREKPKRRHPMEPIDKSFGQEQGLPTDEKLLGTPSAFTCPDCSGTLWEVRDGELLRYRCRVGHAYTAGSMIDAQSDAVERALWTAVRTLEESASTARGVARKTGMLRDELMKKAEERLRHAEVIRQLLMSGEG